MVFLPRQYDHNNDQEGYHARNNNGQLVAVEPINAIRTINAMNQMEDDHANVETDAL